MYPDSLFARLLPRGGNGSAVAVAAAAATHLPRLRRR